MRHPSMLMAAVVLTLVSACAVGVGTTSTVADSPTVSTVVGSGDVGGSTESPSMSPSTSLLAGQGEPSDTGDVQSGEPAQPPEVGDRWTVEQIEAFMKRCVEAEGFSVTENELGALEWRGPAEQREAATAAFDRCRKQLPVSVRTYQPPTEEEIRGWYDTFLEVAACLEREGYEVPPPPSVDSFVESQGANWHPYDLVVADPNLPWGEWVRLNKVCPQGGIEDTSTGDDHAN